MLFLFLNRLSLMWHELSNRVLECMRDIINVPGEKGTILIQENSQVSVMFSAGK